MPEADLFLPTNLADALLSLATERLEQALELVARADRGERLAELETAIDEAGALVRAAAIGAAGC